MRQELADEEIEEERRLLLQEEIRQLTPCLLIRLLRAQLPRLGITFRVENSKNNYAIVFHSKVYCVGKFADASFPYVFEDDRISERIRADLAKNAFHRREESYSQTESSLFVPVHGIVKFPTSPTAENDRQLHCRARSMASALTRSQATTSSGEAICSAKRFSNSRFFASFNMLQPDSSETLSQISCIRSSRSSRLKRSIPRSFMLEAIEYPPAPRAHTQKQGPKTD